MPKWTPEQSEAIYKSGSNIIVSAGAGSGKTAVLSERVLNKLDCGVHVNELLILTFTKAAASEMKERIRKKISSNPKYKDELNLLSSSYITTFDSYALSVLKKYHYILNISNDISITDESLVKLEEKKIIDNIFEELYESHDIEFEYLINNYCVKNDKLLRNILLKVCNSINNYIDKYEYINYLKEDYFSDESIIKYIDSYYELLDKNRKFLRSEIDNLNYYFDNDYVCKVEESCKNIFDIDIKELYKINKVSLPSVPRGSEEEAKKSKENVKSSLDKLLSYSIYGSYDDIRNNILNSKRIVLSILNIVSKYIDELSKYKRNNNIYTFSDIAYLSIKILKENKFIRDEIRDSFKEIVIDEYQDTNDVQDIFISLIENNNVYMVGDIKQSIYRFRGSNPNIFKDKYDSYSLKDGGIKIDLIKNFRSRSEVLNNINRIFELLMDKDCGGANYKESHEMIYGNTLYDEEKINEFNYNLDILEYDRQKDSEFSESEIEIFSIAKDIKNKIESNIQVFDKETSKLRNVNYSDFVIILDRSKYFNDYKRIFEYLGIPLSILQDDTLNTSTDLLLIKNIIDFIIRIEEGDYETNFKYDFISIARSFLYEYSDKDIFEIFKNNTFKETTLFKDFNNILSFNSKTSSELLLEILDITKFYEKLNKIGDYENINTRIRTIYELSNSLNSLGLDIYDFRDYLCDIVENGIDIKYSSYKDNKDSVKIMTIHKSKGLEYPICYFADMNHKFNISDINDLFIVSKYYGLIVPNELDNDNTVIKELYKYSYIKEEISEKIRLLYVALTRAREKMIIVIPKKETTKLEKNEYGVIDEIRRINFNKLSDFIYAIKDYLPEYFSDIDIKSLNLTKNYLYNKAISNKLNGYGDDFNVSEINISNEEIDEKHFSKENYKLITKEEKDNMDLGNKIHEVLELIDFKNFDESIIEDSFIKEKVNSIINSDLLKNVNDANIYHEYEFIYNIDNISYHGIIDLLLDYSDHIDIVDYKLKNISDEKYLEQLNGYKEYIESISDKKVNLYLYSIIDSKIEKVN